MLSKNTGRPGPIGLVRIIAGASDGIPKSLRLLKPRFGKNGLLHTTGVWIGSKLLS